MKLSPSELRAQRLARLASNKTATTTETVAPAAAAAPVAKEITARVADITRMDRGTKLTLAGPFKTDTENPHWVVLADGEPLAKVALADQEKPEEIKSLFATEGYAKAFEQTASHVDMPQLFNTVKAQPYVAAVKNTEAFSALKANAEDTAKQVFQKKAAQYRDEFQTMLMLVAEAQRKNFFTENPLKDAFFKQLKSAGVADPVALIENAFVAANNDHFNTMFKQANKWLDLHPEALADIRQSITNLPVREIPRTASTVSEQAAPVPSSRHNVPIVTASAPVAKVGSTDERSALRAKFNFRGRMLNGRGNG